MSVFKFRPQLESMDPRIVPDAAPVAAPAPEQAQAQPAAPVPSDPADMTDAELDARIAELEARLITLDAEIAATNRIIDAQMKVFTQLVAAADAANKVLAAEEKKLADIEKEFGRDSAEYRGQKTVVDAARSAYYLASGKVVGASEAIAVSFEQLRNLNQQRENTLCELDALRMEKARRAAGGNAAAPSPTTATV